MEPTTYFFYVEQVKVLINKAKVARARRLKELADKLKEFEKKPNDTTEDGEAKKDQEQKEETGEKESNNQEKDGNDEKNEENRDSLDDDHVEL